MKIIIVTKSSIENTPPLEMVAVSLAKQRHEVRLINYSSMIESRDRLKNYGIEVLSLSCTTWPSNVIKKIQESYRFREFVNNILATSQFDVLWICNPDVIPLIKKAHRNNRVILHALELYDKVPRYLKYIKEIEEEGGHIVVPDKMRAYILTAMLTLKNIPQVIHNKPVNHPKTSYIKSKYSDLLPSEVIDKSKKLVLYQGHISKTRPILEIARSVNSFTDLQFVAMGNSEDNYYIQKIKSFGGVHISHVPSPFHLDITSWAKIGIISYDYKSLNMLFCAPNKVFEYAGFGIPFISSYHPNLSTYSADFSYACTEFDQLTLVDAFSKLLHHYHGYSQNALTFYNSISTEEEISSILKLNF